MGYVVGQVKNVMADTAKVTAIGLVVYYQAPISLLQHGQDYNLGKYDQSINTINPDLCVKKVLHWMENIIIFR